MRIWLALASLLLAAGPAAGQGETEAENLLKAQFIDRFTLFVEWPAASETAEPFVIGVYGRDPLTESLRDLVRSQQIQGRPARLVEISDPEEIRGCHVLFIAGSKSDELPRVLARTAERPILTVGDTAGFARQGVLINFFREGNHVRFEINPEAVERSGLRFKSQLLRLGTLVSSPRGGEER